MKSIISKSTMALLLGGLMMTTSCSKDEETDKNNNVTPKNATIKGVVESESQFSLMNEAIELSGNSEVFTDANANLTLFAANNDAFNELFASANVSSMTELKSTLGDEAFSEVILYHAINGNFNLDAFADGFQQTNASNDDGDRLSVFVKSMSNSSIMLNGNDQNGAASVGSTSFAATNGSVIEIDGVVMAQSNFENLEEGESENDMFLDLIAEADASIKTMLESESDESTVLVMNDAQVESLLAIRLRDVLDRDDFETLLDANAQSSLFTQFGVSTLDDLIAQVTLQSMLDLNVTMQSIFDEMEADDKTELIGTAIISGNFDKDDMLAAQSVTSEAGVVFNVTSNNSGDIVLTDSDNNQIVLDGNSTTSANGSIFVTKQVNK